jgi:hypothetical protein
VFEDERRRDGRGRPFGLMVGVVLGVAIVGGVLWYAFRGQSAIPLPNGEVQTVKADPSPYKVKPENPGGMQVENQDKLVYDRVAKGAAPNRVETLLPPPEVPKAPPVKNANGMEETTVAKAPEPKAPPAEPKAPETKPVDMVLTTTKSGTPVPADAKPEVKAAEAKPAAEANSDEKALQAMVKAANAPKAAPAAKASTDPLAAAVAAATGTTPKPMVQAKADTPAVTPASGGGFQVQLASVPTEEAAQAEWKRVSARHKELAGLTPAIIKADLGDKGTYYRLRAGPLADKAAADGLCSTLAADKVGCIVVKP